MHLIAVQSREILASFSCAEVDHLIAVWFRQHLTPGFATLLEALSEPGCALWIGTLTVLMGLCMAWKKSWLSLLTLFLTVPGGALLGETLKLIVQRQRPYLAGPLGPWGGYSFPSGHTIAATLLYGFLALLLISGRKAPRWLPPVLAVPLVLGVAFSRIALGAHFLTDVMGAMVLGSAWLTACWMGVAALRRNMARHNTAMVISPTPQFAVIAAA